MTNFYSLCQFIPDRQICQNLYNSTPYLTADFGVRYSSVTIVFMKLQSLWEIVFSRLEGGRWFSDKGGMVGPP